MELQVIQSKIHLLRGQRVMLDFDLAALYEVPTKALNQAVKRNARRFPPDFMFQLNIEEWQELRRGESAAQSDWSQFVTSSKKHRGYVYLPYAFNEQGVAMLSSVLRSDKAIDANIAIMRAFVGLRHYVAALDEVTAKILLHDQELASINEVLKWLGEENQTRSAEIEALQMKAGEPEDWDNRPRIGFKK